MGDEREPKLCPVCGRGRLLDISHREGSEAPEPMQTADTRQVETFSCGHEVLGPSLAQTAAGTDDLDVEHRRSDETAEPI